MTQSNAEETQSDAGAIAGGDFGRLRSREPHPFPSHERDQTPSEVRGGQKGAKISGFFWRLELAGGERGGGGGGDRTSHHGHKAHAGYI